MKSIGRLSVLVVHDASESGLTIPNAVKRIIKELEALDVPVLEALGCGDGLLMLESHPEIGAVLVGWAEGDVRDGAPASRPSQRAAQMRLMSTVHKRFDALPMFLMTETMSVEDLSAEMAESLAGAIWVTEDSPEWVAGHIRKAVEHYRDRLLPPFFGRLVDYVEEYKYGWHTPGHMGGLAFYKSPAGRLFFDFMGEDALRADLSSSVAELGSVLEHEGVVRDAEQQAAELFGADDTYFVTNGTTMSNQIVFRSVVTPGDIVLLDRNCHKSILNSVIQTGAIPIWMLPVRNHLGMIGPIRPSEMDRAAIAHKLMSHPLLKDRLDRSVRLVVVTNSTYDGTMYDTDEVISRLSEVASTVHFDEAWIPYAPFHPIYANHFAMAQAGKGGDNEPTVVSTTSTHKMLAALSQASMINIRQGCAPLPRDRFNEAFMMHASTSPQYLIVASLDVATKMMQGAPGRALMDDAIGEAVAFRKELVGLQQKLQPGDQWWFDAWQPQLVPDALSPGGRSEFCTVDDKILAQHQEIWRMEPSATWHGFGGLTSGYAMLDPTKVTITTPGLDTSGTPESWGIPAAIVSAVLAEHGVVSEKTGFYSLLFLFSIGVTKGKSSTLVTELFDFKRLFDENAPLSQALPSVYAAHPERYAGVGLRDLALEMHSFLAGVDTASMQKEIAAQLPEPAMTPGEAFNRLVRGEVEHVPLAELNGRVTAVVCLLYPPGVPVVVPGERFDAGTKAIVAYLELFEAWDNRFPGFETEVQGVVKERHPETGAVAFVVNCVKE
ncbi:MAG TPA: Orn/Lys/Arg decarboxylase N-terminal domain-containing protein [Acidimicrobiales bacterium]|nr:Orn/Lys/Arg decarboxylase N-terminal domain-containing protein [Acidimicrobiales bacterium]